MIVDKEVIIKISPSNFKRLSKIGYKNIKCGDEVLIKIEDISAGSSVKINVKCNNCKEIKLIQYNNYNNQLKKQNFYVCKKCCFEKAKETNKIKYGTDCTLKNSEVMEKAKKTMFRKYGVENISKVDYIRQIRSEEMHKNTILYNNIIREKYGTNVSNLEWVKEKKKETTLKNYGVENPTQNPSIFDKSQISGKKLKKHNNGMFYRGSYEKHFLDYCVLNNLIVEKGPTIKYKINGKVRYYHSDFILKNNNLIIEIKSSYYFNKFYETNCMKKKYSEMAGYSLLFLIDKNYDSLKDFLN